MPAPSIIARSLEFQARIDAAKEALEPVDFPWYAYHSIGGLQFFEALCEASGLTLEEMSAGKPLLDIGCADGHLAFYLESLGYRITAVDHAPTSANDMKGIRALKQALGSSVEIVDTDLDRGFTPPGPEYGFVLLLGILYHLKNPFLILETLAESSDYCLLSTRVARRTPSGTNLHTEPVAYLLGEDEANGDPSNFWIFSEAGLRRVIQRSGWDIRALLHSGNTRDSDPATNAGDERIYCLLSRSSLFTNGRLLAGFHVPEGARDGWRWTEPEFRASFFAPESGAHLVEAHLYLNEPRQVELAAYAGERLLSRTSLTTVGAHTWHIALPVLSARETAELRFSVTGELPPRDSRELGIIVNHLRLKAG